MTKSLCIFASCTIRPFMPPCKVKGSCPVLKTWPMHKQNLVEALKLTVKLETSIPQVCSSYTASRQTSDSLSARTRSWQ